MFSEDGLSSYDQYTCDLLLPSGYYDNSFFYQSTVSVPLGKEYVQSTLAESVDWEDIHWGSGCVYLKETMLLDSTYSLYS